MRDGSRVRDTQIEFQWTAFGSTKFAALVGVALVVINLVSPTFYQCLDPILHTTLSSVEPETLFRWLWVAFSLCLCGITTTLMMNLQQSDSKGQATSVCR